jgi:hypothetical protein
MARPIIVLDDAVRQPFEMPMLASFERLGELSRWDWNECAVRRTHQHTTDGDWSLQIELWPQKYPGVVLADPVRDWSSYDQLLIDVYANDDAPLDLIVKITDEDHNGAYEDRFNWSAKLAAGPNQIRIALSDVAKAPRRRALDLRRITSLSLFAASPRESRTIYLDSVRLAVSG